MTLSSRHRIRNSSPGGLRPSTLPLGHGGSPQYWLSHVDGKKHVLFLEPPRPGTEPRTLAWKAAVLTTTLGHPPYRVKCGVWWLNLLRYKADQSHTNVCIDIEANNSKQRISISNTIYQTNISGSINSDMSRKTCLCILVKFHIIHVWRQTICRPLGFKRVYLPLCKVADTPYHI